MNRMQGLLDDLGKESPAFTDLGLMPDLQLDKFVSMASSLPSEHEAIAARVLYPYLDSVMARLSALAKAQKLIRLALDQIRRFLQDLQVEYSPRRGLQFLVEGTRRQLSPVQLSSGERQLVLLISTVLAARDTSRLFIIDEPELSLGVPWQREILDSLLACTEGTACQFLVATHSIEMVTANRDALVRLQRRRSNLLPDQATEV